MSITDFKNKHKGETCFVLGNGPSLTDTDLGKLEFPTFGTNRVYLSGYVPDYYVCVNPLVIEQFEKEIKKLETTRFIPEKFKMKGSIPIDTSQYKPSFGSPEHAIWEGHTVTYVCLQLAYYMGFKRVLLLGVDHKYEQPKGANQEITAEGPDVNHFHPDYFGDGVKWHTADLPRSELAYSMAKREYEQDGREIINCSTSTQLDVFKIQPLNYALSEKKKRVSAIVSAYKSEEFFTDCIWDLKQQTLWAKDDLEIVVICQEGTYEHEQIIEGGQFHNTTLTTVVTPDLPSVFEAWNRGIKASKGKYITYANTDDRHDPKAFEMAADIMDARPEIDLTYHNSFITWKRNQGYEDFKRENANKNLVVGRVQDKPGIFIWPEYSLERLKKGCFMGPQPMWRANLHQKYGYFHSDFPIAGDYEFWLRFAKEDNMYHIPYTLGLYLARWDGVEMGNKEQSDKEAQKALDMHYGRPKIDSGNGNKPDKSVLGALPIRAWPWPRIILFVPMFPALPYAGDVFMDFMEIATQGPALLKAGHLRVDYARERAAEKFMETDFTHILMLDADHKHPPNIVQRLARWVIDDPERLVVGGLNFRRGEPFDPCAYVLGDGEYYIPHEWKKGLMKVDRIGAASLLIAREVFERIKKPWFFYAPGDMELDNWFAEDIIFSKRCEEENIQIFCDMSTTSPHMISAYVDENTYRNYLEQNQENLEVIVKE